uniref:Uncharacterized protein n=1 Tax=Setaria italica TaxID=4555 RepID=K4AN32_SETIT
MQFGFSMMQKLALLEAERYTKCSFSLSSIICVLCFFASVDKIAIF